MKKHFLIAFFTLLFFNFKVHSQCTGTNMWPMCSFPGPASGGLNNSFNAFTFELERSVGIGYFQKIPGNPKYLTEARLHVRNDFMYDPTHPIYNGKLFRTDGNVRVENDWAMWTTRTA